MWLDLNPFANVWTKIIVKFVHDVLIIANVSSVEYYFEFGV